MISNTIYIGMIVALAVSIILPVGCIIYCLKKGGTRGLPIFLLIGVAASLLVSSLRNVLGSIMPMESIFNTSFILFLMVDTLLLVILDTAARTFAVAYSNRTGLGLYKGFAIGSGFAAGNVLFQATNIYQYLTYVKMMNEGTFVPAIVEQDATMEAEAIRFQESLAAAHPMSFFVTALDRGAVVFFDIALVLLLLYFINKKKMIQGIAVVAGIKFAYIMLLNILSYSSTEYIKISFGEGTSLFLTALLYAVTLVASLLCIIKLIKVLPKEPKEMVSLNPYKKIKEDQEARAQRRAWSEVSRLNVRNIKSPEERAVEAEKSQNTIPVDDFNEDDEISDDEEDNDIITDADVDTSIEDETDNEDRYDEEDIEEDPEEEEYSEEDPEEEEDTEEETPGVQTKETSILNNTEEDDDEA